MQKAGNFRVIGLVIVVGIFVFIIGSSNPERSFQLSTSGYSSAFEGPSAQFFGVKYNDMEYTASNAHGASEHEFDTVMHFDPDGISSGMPKINGEMTAVFLPEESLSSVPSWVPESWLLSNGYVSNPVTGVGGVNPPWNWNVSNLMIQMQEYDMRWYVSFNSAWSGASQPNPSGAPYDYSTGEAPNPTYAQNLAGDVWKNAYQNTEVWIKFDITPTWYIQGGGTAYFAIAECNLATTASMQTKDNNGNIYPASTTESIFPYSQNDPLYFYYGAFGTGSESSKAPEQYEGKNLNPAYFTNALYAHIDLQNFGVSTYPVNGLSSRVQGDVATFEFDIRVFVIGQYTVQDIQKSPSQYGLTSPSQIQGVNWLTGIIGWLSSPTNDALLMGVIILVLIIIFAPWLLLVIVSLFAGGRKR
jgi:hypothetical protein